MKFLLDANVEYRLATFLTSLKHDVKTIAHDYPHSLPDQDVLALAVQERRILLTNDRDFGDLIFHQHHQHYGVILFRLKNTKDIQVKMNWLQTVLQTYSARIHEYRYHSPRYENTQNHRETCSITPISLFAYIGS